MTKEPRNDRIGNALIVLSGVCFGLALAGGVLYVALKAFGLG